jgi:anti-sigma factor (TIGR02949 family)
MMDDTMTGAKPACNEVIQQLWDYLDEELTPERMAAIAAHLSGCSRCFPQFEFEQAFLQAIRSVRDESPPPAQVRERVLATLRAKGVSC